MEQPSWQRFLYLGFPENYHLAMENHHFCDRRYIVQNGWFSTVMLVFQGLLIYLMRYLTHHLLEMSWACFWNYKWSVTSISIFCSNLLYNVHRKSHDLNSPFHFPSSTSQSSHVNYRQRWPWSVFQLVPHTTSMPWFFDGGMGLGLGLILGDGHPGWPNHSGFPNGIRARTFTSSIHCSDLVVIPGGTMSVMNGA